MAWSSTPNDGAWSAALATNITKVWLQNTGPGSLLIKLVATGGGAPSGMDGVIVKVGEAIAFDGLAGHDVYVRSFSELGETTYDLTTS